MSRKGINISFLLFAFCSLIFSSTGQSPSFRFDHLSTLNGLYSNRIYSILQDSRGLVWIGTNLGLNSFNGYEVKRYEEPFDAQLLGNMGALCLFEDNGGVIWIGTESHGVVKYDPISDRFNHFRIDPGDPLIQYKQYVRSIYQDTKGTIWAGSYGGLSRFEKETETFTYYLPFPQNLDSTVNFVFSMMEDSDGTLWIGTGSGILQFDRSTGKFLPFTKSLGIPGFFQQVCCFHQDEEGLIWFGTYKGLFRYSKKNDQLIRIHSRGDGPDDHLEDEIVVSIQPSPQTGSNDLWLATRNGLVRYNRLQDRFVRILIDPAKSGSLSNNSINALWMNEMGILWIATAWSGVDKLDTHGSPYHQVFMQSPSDHSLFSPESFCMARDGELWVGAVTGGLFRFDPQMNLLAQYKDEKGFTIDIEQVGLVTNTPECICEGSDGTLWVGLAGWGPAIFDREKEEFIYLDMLVPEGNSRPDRFSDILEDRTGTVWFATENGLYVKKNTDRRMDPFRTVEQDILISFSIEDIYEDSRGDLYFGTYYHGVFCLRHNERTPPTFRQYAMEVPEMEQANKGSVHQTVEDAQGTLWVASDHGIYTYDPTKDRFERLSDSSDLPVKRLYHVFPDRKGNLWLSHYPQGLMRYNLSNKSIKSYNSRDGLPFDGLVPRYWYQSLDGKLFIGSWWNDGNGFFYFHPDSISDNIHIPPISFTDFTVKNEPFTIDSSISVKQHITLKYNQNFFSFQFAAIDYTNPGQNQYAWYLQGLDENWIYSGNQHEANYTSVPPGKYIFRVKGSNNDGYWNEEGASMAITILPPPWKTWWAYVLYGFFLTGMFMAWRIYDLKRQQLQHELELEHVESEKLKELDRLKSRFFANISHEFRTPLTLILGPLQKLFSKAADEETREELGIMHRNARRLQNLINQLLDLSKLESGKMELDAREENVVSLVKSYVQQFESLAKHKGITLDFISERDDIPAWVDRDKIEKILYNLLGNAFKWTGEGGRIQVTVSGQQSAVSGQTKIANRRPPIADLPEQCVVVSISDTGAGIPQEKLPRIFDRFYQADDSYVKDGEGTGIGLALTKELVELHGGTITVESVVGQGTTLRILLPVGIDVLKSKSKEQKSKIRNDFDIENRQPAIDIQEPATCNLQPAKESTPTDAPLLLIVEDNADLRLYIRGILGGDYRILEAGSGRQGLTKALEHIPDLVLTDVMMPEMDGYELCRNLKTDVRTSHIPVILLTARASMENKLEGLETGADEYLYKPFNPHELIVRVHNMIEQRKRIRDHFIRQLGLSGKLFTEASEIIVSSMDEHFLTKAREVVEEHMGNPDFSVEEFAQLIGLSRSHLYRKMTALINLNPSDFIRSLRLSRAAQRLIQKSGTVSEIAFDVGFNNLSYFSRCFHEQFGILPSEYGDFYINH